MYGIDVADDQRGFTLMETVMIIIIIGILAGIAVMKLSSTLDAARFEATRAELDMLARAVAGDPDSYTDDAQADFGYVGDVGALPPDLDALAVNPGLATWSGPYISGNFSDADYKKDAWNIDYIYGGTFIRSVGSGSNIDKTIASGPAELLDCGLYGSLLDGNNSAPGTDFADSVEIHLAYPDGAGLMAHAVANPGPDGSFSFANIPVGFHTLQVIYIPDNDTVDYQVSFIPGHDVYITTNFPADLW